MDGQVYRQNDWLCYTAISLYLSSKKCFHTDPVSLCLSGTGENPSAAGSISPVVSPPPLPLASPWWRRPRPPKAVRGVLTLDAEGGAPLLCGGVVWGDGGPSLAGSRRCSMQGRRGEVDCARGAVLSPWLRLGIHSPWLRGRVGRLGRRPRTQVLVALRPPAAATRAAWWLTWCRLVLLTKAQNGACGVEWGAAAAVLGGGLGMDPVPLCPDLFLGFGGGLWSRVRRSVVVGKVLLRAGHRRTRVAWWCWPWGLPDLVSG
jgi:hypothetical protein